MGQMRHSKPNCPASFQEGKLSRSLFNWNIAHGVYWVHFLAKYPGVSGTWVKHPNFMGTQDFMFWKSYMLLLILRYIICRMIKWLPYGVVENWKSLFPCFLPNHPQPSSSGSFPVSTDHSSTPLLCGTNVCIQNLSCVVSLYNPQKYHCYFCKWQKSFFMTE